MHSTEEVGYFRRVLFSDEFQQTAFLENRVYQLAYSRSPTYFEFTSDMSILGLGSDGNLSAHRTAFLEGFAHSANFLNLYAVLQNADYVNALITRSGISITATDRNALVTGLNNGTETRGSVLGKLADNEGFQHAQFNNCFVLMEYFGYLRRDPDEIGFAFWLGKLDQRNDQEFIAEMIKAFIMSDE